MLNVVHVLEAPVIEALGWALVHFLWQATILAAVLAALLLQMRTALASRRYLAQCVVLGAMAICPLVTWWWIASSMTPRELAVPAEPITPVVVVKAPENDLDKTTLGPAVTSQFETESPIMVAPAPVVRDFVQQPASEEMSQSEPVVSWKERIQHEIGPFLPCLVGFWLLGVIVLSLRLLVGWRIVQRMKRTAVTPVAEIWQLRLRTLASRMGILHTIKLVESTLVEVPTVIGWLRPVILLPISLLTNLTPQQLEAVIAHELAHIRRHDYLINLIQTAIETLLFYHPAVWWLSGMIRAEREHCCDDLAVALCEDPVTYISALAAMEELRSSPAMTLAANGGSLLTRVRRIVLAPTSDSRRSTRWGASLIALTALVALGLTTYFASHASDDTSNTMGSVSDTVIAKPEDSEETNDSASSSDWGDIVNGLRVRVVPVTSGMNDEVIDLSQRTDQFETLDDVTLAVEIQNASDKPVTLRDVRYGEHYGESKGTLASDWFGQFLFSIEYFDASGKRVERPELIPLGKQFGMSDGAQESTLAPKQTIKMLLRPNRWISALSQQPLVGPQRAVVKYRGAAIDGSDKRVDVVSRAVEFSVKRRGYRPSGVPSPQLGDDPKNDPELEPDITKLLVWGPPVNGLRAALDVVPESGGKGISHGTKPRLRLVVQNVSQNVGDMPVRLPSLMWLSELPVTATNAKGESFDIQSTWYTGITPVVRVLLKPQQIVTFDAGNLGLAVTKERAEKFEDVTNRRLVAPQGKYSLTATERFGTSFHLKDNDGNVTFPQEGDFKGDLTTGLAPVDISNEIIESEIVDAVTGKPVEGATVSFGIVKPKTTNSEEQRLALMAWGPKSPSKIYFTIPNVPEDIAQRSDRDELEVRFGVGNHPDYENYYPEERIPLKQFFHEGPAQAKKVLSKIKLTPKKNAKDDLSQARPANEMNELYPRVFRGKITNADGNPVAGALIEWGPDYPHAAPRESVRSAEDGTYRLEVMKAGGKFKLGVSAAGCAPFVAKGMIPGPKSEPKELNVTLSGETTLRVTIVDEARQPIPDLEVQPMTPVRGFNSSFSIIEQPEPIPGHSQPLKCDAQGVCLLKQLLPAPEPLLKAESTDTPAQADYKQRTNQEGWLSLRITRRGKWMHEYAVTRREFFEANGVVQVVVPDYRNPRKEAEKNGTIFGQVVDHEGKPLTDYLVTLRYRSETKSVSHTEGLFEWGDKLDPANSYEVRVFAKGFAPKTDRIVPKQTQRTQPYRIELKPHTSAEFVLLDETTRQPIPKVIVVAAVAKQEGRNYLEWNDLDHYADGHHGLTDVVRITTDANGRFSVPEGDVAATLLILTPGYSRTIVTPKTRPARNELGLIPITLPRAASIHGVLAMNSRLSRQASGVSLNAGAVHDFDQMFQGLKLDSKGECVIESLAPGDYSLSLDHSDGNISTACWNKKITLKPGEKKVVLLGEMTGTLVLRGRMSPFTDVTLTRKPEIRAVNKVLDSDAVLSVATISDVDGNFEFDQLEAGSYSIELARLQRHGGRSFGVASNGPTEIELTKNTYIDFTNGTVRDLSKAELPRNQNTSTVIAANSIQSQTEPRNETQILNANVPNGLRLELVGMSTIHTGLSNTDQRQWWNGQGKDIGTTEKLFDEKRRMRGMSEYAKGREAVVRLTVLRDSPFTEALRKRAAWIEGEVDGVSSTPAVFGGATVPLLFHLTPSGPIHDEETFDLQLHTHFVPSADAKTTRLRFGFGHEATSRTYDEKGKLAHESGVNEHPEIWRRFGLLRIESQPEGTVVLTKPMRGLGDLGIGSVQLLLVDGTVINSTTPTISNSGNDERHLFNKINIEDVEGVTLRVRTVSHWVTFSGLPLNVEPTSNAKVEVQTVMQNVLEFLKLYPKLQGMSLDMTEPQFLEIVKQQELKTRKTGEGDQTAYRIGLGDGLYLIVMFREDGTCRGIQRVRGEDEPLRDGLEESKTLNGLRTRITLLTQKPAVGSPLLVKIELQNVGEVERTYPWQGANPDYLLEVIGPDGKPSEFINGGQGIQVRPTKIKPGETVVAWDNLDVASMFLLPKAGRYEIKLRGPDQFKLDAANPNQTHPFPTSNTVAVTMADGTLNDIQATFVRIRTIAPNNWQISTSGNSIFDLQKTTTPRAEFILRFTESLLADDEKMWRTMPSEYLGLTRLGHAYLAINPLAKTEWPDCVEQIRKSLPTADGLEFLKSYPKLQALSLKMTEPQFLEIVKQQGVKTRRSVEGNKSDGEKATHHINLGDGHSLIVMFDKDGKCSGIQRVRGDEKNPEAIQALQGVILSVDQNRGVAEISLGEADGVKKLARFEVRAKGLGGKPADQPVVKGIVEVVHVGQDKSEVRIIQQNAANKIVERDHVTPVSEKQNELKRALEPRTLRNPSVLLPDHWIVQAVGFDGGGKELVTASNQSFITIRRWDLVSMKLLSEIKLQGDKHGRAVHSETLKFSGDRKRVIAATDEYVGIWDTVTGKLLRQLPFETKSGIYECVIDKLDATPDLSLIVGHWATPSRLTLSYDAHVIVWDGATGKILRTLIDKGATDLKALDLSTDGKRLVTTNGGGAKIWDTSTGQMLRSIPNDNTGRKHSEPEVSTQYTSHVWSVQFSPDGKQLAMGDILGVKLIDTASGRLLRQLEGPYRYSSNSSPGLVFSKDGERLARLGTQEQVTIEMKDFPPDYRPEKDSKTKHRYVVPIWSTRTGTREFELHTEANDAAFTEDGQCFAVVFSDMQQALSVWQLNGDDTDDIKTAGPGPHSRVDRVEENGHYVGKVAAEYMERFKPTWGETKLGLQYGIALTTPTTTFKPGERALLVAFFRNASDKPIKFNTAPDFYGNAPKILNAKGELIAIENIPLLGHIPHYHETLAPGEALGPFYMSFGLGENPSPNQQHWHPLLKSPAAGEYKLTHTVTVNFPETIKDAPNAKAELTSSTVAFEIVDGQQTSKTSASRPNGQTNEFAATILGEQISLEQITPAGADHKRQELSLADYQKWLVEYRATALLQTIVSRVLKDYEVREKISPSDQELEALHRDFMEKYLAKYPRLDDEAKKKIGLQIFWSLGSAKDWRTAKALHSKYGGRVATSAFGAYTSIEGRNAIVKEYHTRGEIKFHRAELEQRFWEKLKNDRVLDVTIPADRVKERFATPPWEAGFNQILEQAPDAADKNSQKPDGQPAKDEAVAKTQTDVSLSDAVRDFNAENKQLGRGLDQPVVTEDEVIASIKRDEWKRGDPWSLNEKEIAAFKEVTESKRLPKGSYLDVRTEDRTDTFLYKQLWQVQLMIPAIGHDGFVGLTIRNTLIAEEKIDPKNVAWGKPDDEGLSLGAYLSPRKAQYALGERVRLRLFVRNDGKQPVGGLTFYNVTTPVGGDFTVTDQTGAKVAVRPDRHERVVGGATRGGLAPGDVHAFHIVGEISIGGDPSKNPHMGLVIDARSGQKLQLKVRAHNGNDRERAESDIPAESGIVAIDVVDVISE